MGKISFIDRVIAVIKGDDATVKAAKIQKKAKSLLKIEISNLENDIIKQEDAIEDAKERYNKAVINFGNTDFSDRYVERLTDYYNEWKEAEDRLEQQKEQLAFYKEVLADVSGEASADAGAESAKE